MSGQHDPSESHDYRPKSPNLSQFTQPPPPPPPRLSRIPSNQFTSGPGHTGTGAGAGAGVADSSYPSVGLPSGYSFSPRGSYDASPFFSPQTTSPSSSYFTSRNQAPSAPPPPSQSQSQSQLLQHQHQHQPLPPSSSYSLSHPVSQPQSYSPQSFRAPNPPQSQGQYFHNQNLDYPSPQQSRPYQQQGYNPNLAHYPQEFQYPPQQALTYTQPGGNFADMPRTRSSRNTEDAEYQVNSRSAPPVKSEQFHNIQPPAPVAPVASSDPTLGIDVRTKFPVARIKRIMQADEDVGKVAQATPTAVSKALELFMIALVTKGAAEARASHSKRVTAQHLKTALMNDGQFDFLTDICENIPDEASKKGRAKSEPRTESDEEVVPKKKPRAARKKKADSDDESD